MNDLNGDDVKQPVQISSTEAARYFPSSFDAARRAFLNAIEGKAASTRFLPSLAAPSQHEGVLVGTDVVVLGDPKSERVLLMLAGTHGPEGFTGSGCQQFFLDRFLDRFAEFRVVLVHMINAYGSAAGLRCTEEGVDLNRNFIDFDSAIDSARENPEYSRANAILEKELEALLQGRALDEAVESARSLISAEGLMSSAFRGQYAFGSGLGFGGIGPTASRRRIDSIIANELKDAKYVFGLDIHTGLGEFGKALLLSMTEDEGATQNLEALLPERLTFVNRPGSSLPYRVKGDLLSYIDQSLAAAEVHSVLVEYGTYAADGLLTAVLNEFFIRQSGGSLQLSQVTAGLSLVSDFFYPADAHWQASVLNELPPIFDAALEGLSVD